MPREQLAVITSLLAIGGPALVSTSGALNFGGGARRRRRQFVCAAGPDGSEPVDVGAPERLITSVGLGLLWAAALCERLQALNPEF